MFRRKKNGIKKSDPKQNISQPCTTVELPSPDQKISLKKGMVIKSIGGKDVAVATAEAAISFKGMMVLNPTSRFVLEMLTGKECSIDEISKAMSMTFDVNQETAQNDILPLIVKLYELGLVTF